MAGGRRLRRRCEAANFGGGGFRRRAIPACDVRRGICFPSGRLRGGPVVETESEIEPYERPRAKKMVRGKSPFRRAIAARLGGPLFLRGRILRRAARADGGGTRRTCQCL